MAATKRKRPSAKKNKAKKVTKDDLKFDSNIFSPSREQWFVSTPNNQKNFRKTMKSKSLSSTSSKSLSPVSRVKKLNKQSDKRIRKLQKEIDSLREENRKYEKALSSLNYDPRFRDHVIEAIKEETRTVDHHNRTDPFRFSQEVLEKLDMINEDYPEYSIQVSDYRNDPLRLVRYANKK